MYSTEGIVLNKIPVGEADAIFSIYTKDFGKIRAVAQGIKKEEAKLKGHLEKFNLVGLSFVLGKNGERLTHAGVINHWPIIRSDFRKLSVAWYISELADKHCLAGQKDEHLWQLLVCGFLELEAADFSEENSGQVFLQTFEAGFMEVLGYAGEKNIGMLGELVVARPFQMS